MISSITPHRRDASIFRATSAAIIIWASAGCDNGSPSEPRVPAPESFVALRLTGPSTIAPGATAQFVAIGERRNGTTAELTTQVRWTANPPLLTFTEHGMAHARSDARGETTITATYGTSPQSTMHVLLLESGTFRVSGIVTDDGFAVGDATVEVIDGTGTGLRATTDPSGHYALYGVAGSVRFRISADGFEPTTAATTVSDHARANFSLTPLASATDISGTWILSATAAAGCRSLLPDGALQGDIEVVVAHHGSRPQFRFPGPHTWTGRLVNDVVTFVIGGPEDPSTHELRPIIVGPVTATSWLEIVGLATATVAREEITGTMDGMFRVSTERPAGAMECRDRAHRVVMRRR